MYSPWRISSPLSEHILISYTPTAFLITILNNKNQANVFGRVKKNVPLNQTQCCYDFLTSKQ